MTPLFPARTHARTLAYANKTRERTNGLGDDDHEQYTLIFVLLSIEVVMFCLLILPFPSSWYTARLHMHTHTHTHSETNNVTRRRKAIVVGLSQVPKIEAVKYSLAVLFLLVVVLFFGMFSFPFAA